MLIALVWGVLGWIVLTGLCLPGLRSAGFECGPRLREGGPLFGLLFQRVGVTRASNPFVPLRSYVFFMFYILSKSILNAKVI